MIKLPSSLTLDLPQRRRAKLLVVGDRLLVGAALTLLGTIHLVLSPVYGAGTPYIGVLFLIACVASWAAALGILAGVRGAWILGVLIGTGVGTSLLLASTVGLPSFTESLAAPWAVPSLGLAGLTVALYAASAALRRSPLAV